MTGVELRFRVEFLERNRVVFRRNRDRGVLRSRARRFSLGELLNGFDRRGRAVSECLFRLWKGRNRRPSSGRGQEILGTRGLHGRTRLRKKHPRASRRGRRLQRRQCGSGLRVATQRHVEPGERLAAPRGFRRERQVVVRRRNLDRLGDRNGRRWRSRAFLEIVFLHHHIAFVYQRTGGAERSSSSGSGGVRGRIGGGGVKKAGAAILGGGIVPGVAGTGAGGARSTRFRPGPERAAPRGRARIGPREPGAARRQGPPPHGCGRRSRHDRGRFHHRRGGRSRGHGSRSRHRGHRSRGLDPGPNEDGPGAGVRRTPAASKTAVVISVGAVIISPHFGHGAETPARWVGTRNLASQCGQVNLSFFTSFRLWLVQH